MRATANLTTKDGLFYFSSTVAPRIIDQKGKILQLSSGIEKQSYRTCI